MKEQPVCVIPPMKLTQFDPDYDGGFNQQKVLHDMDKLCRRIGSMQELLYANRKHALVLLFQGLDTSGKDSAAKCVLQYVNPAGVQTSNFITPSSEEAAHDFLWRIHKAVPKYGNIGVFNRSHYEDILVPQVMKILPKPVWEQRYEQINLFEEYLSKNNIILLKFFLHISPAEQKKRLIERREDLTKQWKYGGDDHHTNHHKLDFRRAHEEMINRCSPSFAPWHVIPSNKKWYRNYLIAMIVLNELERLRMTWPTLKKSSKKN